MEGTGEIKYPGQTKTSTAALRLTEGSVKDRGRKPRKKITWSSRLGFVRRASYPSMENICKLKTLNEGMKGCQTPEQLRRYVYTKADAVLC